LGLPTNSSEQLFPSPPILLKVKRVDNPKISDASYVYPLVPWPKLIRN